MAQSSSFHMLHKDAQRWIWKQNWESLRDIQEQAIAPVLQQDTDMIICASTASGKTEAAFLPACSYIVNNNINGVGILYISPLKALINDQHRRIENLACSMGISATPWHGDVSPTIKNKQITHPDGIILITPESLESILLNRFSWCQHAMQNLCYIIIDEFHYFIGTERGCQLQSLIHRLEFMLGRTVPRIALSATLGDMDKVAKQLRPDAKKPCVQITSNASHTDLKLQLRGYEIDHSPQSTDQESETFLQLAAEDMFSFLRNKSNLAFANSRSMVEEMAAKLAELCDADCVPNEFFPHHGNLSKNIRHDLENRLQKGAKPTTAVCTNTLELGIDIGNVDSIAQITAPHSVASLRQRLGRSGRRGQPAVLRMFIQENKIGPHNHFVDRLRLHTIQCVAMINCLLNKWYEPPADSQYNFSTLIQQTLSVIGQYGGVTASQLWTLLCKSGPFKMVDQKLYGILLRAMSRSDLIVQTSDGQLIVGHKGESILGHYAFYAAFKTPDEYTLKYNERILGTIPVDQVLTPKQHIIFAGKYWEIASVSIEDKTIILNKTHGGTPPLFSGSSQFVHDIVRREMRNAYLEGKPPRYLDKTAKKLFMEAVKFFHNIQMDQNEFYFDGNNMYLCPWLGDNATNAITLMLRQRKLSAGSFRGVIEIQNCSKEKLIQSIDEILSAPKPDAGKLVSLVVDAATEKYDYILPENLIAMNYANKFLDIDKAWKWLINF